MNYKAEITNKDLYYEKVDTIDINFHKGKMHGDVVINGRVISGEHGIKDYQKEYGFIIVPDLTYDVMFNDNYHTDCKGFKKNMQECRDYIEIHNGTEHSYFSHYKGGTVSIVCNETEETVDTISVKHTKAG